MDRYVGDYDIFGFYVSMRNTQIVEVLNCFHHLEHAVRGLSLAQSALLLQLLEQSAALHVLQDDVKLSGVIEKAIHRQNIAMRKATLQPNFQRKLVDHQIRFD